MKTRTVQKTAIEFTGDVPVDEEHRRLTASLNRALDQGAEDAVQAALNTGCLAIQKALGITEGGFAGIYFSDDSLVTNLKESIAELLAKYAVAEFDHSKPDKTEPSSLSVNTYTWFILYDMQRCMGTSNPECDNGFDSKIFWSNHGWAEEWGAGLYTKQQALDIQSNMHDGAALQIAPANLLSRTRLFVVSLIEDEEESEDEFVYFPCFAMDIQHAMEQALNAYPKGNQFGEIPRRRP
jgi:hypothetical protein